MGEVKVTEVYGESQKVTDGLFSDHVIVSEQLKELLAFEATDEPTSPDSNELSIITFGHEMINGLVLGDLFSIFSGEQLILKFNAKSDCAAILKTLRASTMDTTEGFTIDMTGKYGFHAEGKNIKTWELTVLEDKSALLTIKTEVTNVTFR